MQDGPTSVLPPSGCGMFLAPHEFGANHTPTEDGIGGYDETAARDTVLFDNTSSHVMWAYAADGAKYPHSDAELSDMDGERLRDPVGTLSADWHPALRRLVAESPA